MIFQTSCLFLLTFSQASHKKCAIFQSFHPDPKRVHETCPTYLCCSYKNTLQEINISHLGKRKILFKMPFWGGFVSSLEGISKSMHYHQCHPYTISPYSEKAVLPLKPKIRGWRGFFGRIEFVTPQQMAER